MCAKRSNDAFNTTVGTVNVDLPAKTKSRKNFIQSEVVSDSEFRHTPYPNTLFDASISGVN